MSERARQIEETSVSEAPAEPVVVPTGEADPDGRSTVAGASGRASGTATTPAAPEATCDLQNSSSVAVDAADIDRAEAYSPSGSPCEAPACGKENTGTARKANGHPDGCGETAAHEFMQGGEVVSRLAHNQEDAGSSPAPATRSPATEAGATVEARTEVALDRAIFPLEHASFEGQPFLSRWLA